MKTRHLLLILLLNTAALVSHTLAADPFKLSVVPSSSREPQGQVIELADDKPHEFHVVLTNTSEQPQPVFEAWNSYGYDTVTFDLTLPDGKKFHVAPGTRAFTRNFPSTFSILPGESFVYRIQLDEQWKDRPKFEGYGDVPIKLAAIYQVYASPAATTYGVWTGRVESKSYDFVLHYR